MHIATFAGVLGASISGLDIRRATDDAIATIHQLVLRRRVIVIRGQQLGPEEQVAFTLRLGPLGPAPYVDPHPASPDVIRVLKAADETDVAVFGGTWHSDFSFLPAPPALTILHAIELPPVGGDTQFACLCTAYSRLRSDLKRLAQQAVAIHSPKQSFDPLKRTLKSMTIRTDKIGGIRQEHPLVTIHPETGEPVLYFNPTYVRDLLDNRRLPAPNLLEYLHEHVPDEAITYRHAWLAGDVIICDNRAALHKAPNDYDGYRRELQRTTTAGSPPAPWARSAIQ
jgi:taurine dioxygenase